jgi:hypothetical protein
MSACGEAQAWRLLTAGAGAERVAGGALPPRTECSTPNGSAVCRRVDGTALGPELERAQVVHYRADQSRTVRLWSLAPSARATQEAISEAVAKLVRSQITHPGSSASPANHSPRRLPACRLFRIRSPTDTLMLRDPLLNLSRKDVVIELGLELA